MSARAKKVSLAELGIAAGLLAMFLFGILYGTTGHPAALVAGCGGGLLLLVISLLTVNAVEATQNASDSIASD